MLRSLGFSESISLCAFTHTKISIITILLAVNNEFPAHILIHRINFQFSIDKKGEEFKNPFPFFYLPSVIGLFSLTDYQHPAELMPGPTD